MAGLAGDFQQDQVNCRGGEQRKQHGNAQGANDRNGQGLEHAGPAANAISQGQHAEGGGQGGNGVDNSVTKQALQWALPLREGRWWKLVQN